MVSGKRATEESVAAPTTLSHVIAEGGHLSATLRLLNNINDRLACKLYEVICLI